MSYFPATHIKSILKYRVSYYLERDILNNIKKLFGGEGKDTTNIRFSDLNMIKQGTDKEMKEYSNYIVRDRSGIRVSRETKITEDGSLFNYEYINPNFEFQGDIEVKNISKENLKYLLACLFHLDKIGGEKSRGLGSVEVSIYEYFIFKIYTSLVITSYFPFKALLKSSSCIYTF